MNLLRSTVSRPAALLLAGFALLLAAGSAAAQPAEARRIADALEVLKAIITVPESEVTQAMARGASAVAIIPGARRLGFVVGVQSGRGVMLARGAGGQWGSPLFIRLSGASVGLQAGVQSADLVLFFRTKQSVEAILDGAFTMGIDVGVSAGSLGRQAGAQTDADMRAEIYSYSRTRGLFAGVSLSGATISVDEAACAAYYGRAGLTPRDILGKADFSSAAVVVELRRALAASTSPTGR
jgi:lipid-binding SYLF domain-containing protein